MAVGNATAHLSYFGITYNTQLAGSLQVARTNVRLPTRDVAPQPHLTLEPYPSTLTFKSESAPSGPTEVLVTRGELWTKYISANQIQLYFYDGNSIVAITSGSQGPIGATGATGPAPTDTIYDIGNRSGSFTIDWNNGRNQMVTLASSTSYISAMTNVISGSVMTIHIYYNGGTMSGSGFNISGVPAMSYPDNINPTYTNSSGKLDIITLQHDHIKGKYRFGFAGKNYSV